MVVTLSDHLRSRFRTQRELFSRMEFSRGIQGKLEKSARPEPADGLSLQHRPNLWRASAKAARLFRDWPGPRPILFSGVESLEKCPDGGHERRFHFPAACRLLNEHLKDDDLPGTLVGARRFAEVQCAGQGEWFDHWTRRANGFHTVVFGKPPKTGAPGSGFWSRS